MAIEICGRCKREIKAAIPEQCSVCAGPLRVDCWEGPSYCGEDKHPGQDEKIRAADERFARKRDV